MKPNTTPVEPDLAESWSQPNDTTSVYRPSLSGVTAWESRVKNFAPNIGHDCGGRLMVAWLDK